ncbi:hypothetical protein [Erythrobacter donghaensis]|uniref:hypothetical protein n=1 Tax=Erythrobacter donghaensis TaxID=267135 RepID=UPI000A3B4611|nr:hypothetical protein [Erythrobacter donghaensis]
MLAFLFLMLTYCLSCAFATLGAVLLASWFWPSAERFVRVAGCAFGGALVTIVPVLLADTGMRRIPASSTLLGALLVMVLALVLVALPVAWLAQRRLDRSAVLDTSVFE